MNIITVLTHSAGMYHASIRTTDPDTYASISGERPERWASECIFHIDALPLSPLQRTELITRYTQDRINLMMEMHDSIGGEEEPTHGNATHN